MSREELHLTAEGQALCRGCYGIYSSKLATLKARAHEIYRRCACGAVLTPMGDSSITPYPDADRGALDLGSYFQPRKYECACGTSFWVTHDVMAVLSCAVVAFCVFAALRAQDEDVLLWLLFGASILSVSAHEAYCRIRYPRVTSAE